MKIGLISFSGRKGDGNCSSIARYIENFLETKQHDISLMYVIDLKINPCLGCSYECVKASSCPIEDDVTTIYEFIMTNELVIFIVPVYSAAPPATYFAWRERSQGIFESEEKYQVYKQVKKLFLVVGNADAGGEDAINIIKSGEDSSDLDVILLESHKYNISSISGRLIEVPEVKKIINEQISKIDLMGTKIAL